MVSKRQVVARQQSQELEARSSQVQGRAKQRNQQILDVTNTLLEQVGLDDLSTALIAKEVGISVGALYHYYPNKYAILYAIGKQWLDEIERALLDMVQWDIESTPLETLVDAMLARNLKVYQRQRAVLALVQAMFSVPELRELDQQHDAMVISYMAELFKRMGIKRRINERERLARLYLECSHAAILVVVNQKGERAKRTLADTKLMLCALLKAHLSE